MAIGKPMMNSVPEAREDVKVLVGQQQREFTLNRRLLCETSTFFRDSIEAVSTPTDDSHDDDEEAMMWLPAESPEMFELFVLWLYRPHSFSALVDSVIPRLLTRERDIASYANNSKLQGLRWNLARLHVFASVIDLPALQDVAMDAIQDLYLRCDLDVSPRFIAYLYQECDATHALRLRKWAVAMLGWSLNGADRDAALFERLFHVYPALAEDYRIHLKKMAQSKADVRIKNPQLRLPMNKLRSGERFFGFRLCSFHSHRASVGEGLCPHLLKYGPLSPAAAGSPRSVTGMILEEEFGSVSGSDVEDADGILSPVGEMRSHEVSFLDLS
ncbi:hypothetical protein QBC39DRAFT_347659 [Podospora conica]|nr:hypothetical protein QBC39DRAFT_347659 [Schizothecium conicum]